MESLINNTSFALTPQGLAITIVVVWLLWLSCWVINQIHFLVGQAMMKKLILREICQDLKHELSETAKSKIIQIEEAYGRKP